MGARSSSSLTCVQSSTTHATAAAWLSRTARIFQNLVLFFVETFKQECERWRQAKRVTYARQLPSENAGIVPAIMSCHHPKKRDHFVNLVALVNAKGTSRTSQETRETCTRSQHHQENNRNTTCYNLHTFSSKETNLTQKTTQAVQHQHNNFQLHGKNVERNSLHPDTKFHHYEYIPERAFLLHSLDLGFRRDRRWRGGGRAERCYSRLHRTNFEQMTFDRSKFVPCGREWQHLVRLRPRHLRSPRG